MAEDAVIQVDPPPDVPPEKGRAGQIHEDVQRMLTARHSEVRSAVVEHLANEKLEERKKMVLGGLNKLKEARSALQKIRPKQFAYDANGKVTSEGFDKAQVDEMKKHKEQIAKIEAALEDALGNANYDKLAKVGGSDKSEKAA